MARILTIIPYEFFPPRYGGALRCFYLLKEMSKYHDVYLLTVQPEDDFKKKGQMLFPENVKVITMADQQGFRSLLNIFPDRVANALNSRVLKRSIFEKGNLYLLSTYPVLKKLLRENQFDFINYENLECFGVLYKFVQRLSPGTMHVYDAHNVDSELWLQQNSNESNRKMLDYAAGALALEKKLHSTTSLCFCCSRADKLKLEKLNNNLLDVKVIPNGVDINLRPFDTNTEKWNIQNILFCGTLDYTPNIEGVLWFYKNVFPLIKKQQPSVSFTVIGKMDQPGPYKELMEDPSVNFIGFVTDVVPYYINSAVFVVPLLAGSGTRLKILEAMSMGNPIVSTTVGAEGLELDSGKQIILADEPDAFANCVLTLFKSKELFERQRKIANDFVKRNYDWKIIGTRMNEQIELVIKNKSAVTFGRLDK